MSKKANQFLENLKKIHPEGFVEKYELPDDLKKEFNPNRFWSIIKSEGKKAKVDEAKKLIDYYRRKTGKNVQLDDLFGGKEED
ncbi:MAG: hypothetical protein HC913_15945 [Microscillaceae bacterium]|nr:hypothetical protein [Microscillaceae bacterium]